MAASIMMDTLKQIQRDLTDQKEYIRNLHVIHKNINEKYDIMEGNLSDLHKKIDQQQLTIQRLEQHIKKNNMLLFGNDDPEINFENKCIVLKKSNSYEKEKKNDNNLASVEQSEKYMENIELNKLQNTLKETDIDETEKNCKEENKNEQFQEKNNDEDKGEVLTSNEIREIKELIKECVAARKTSAKETRPVRKEKVVKISPTFFSEDQISKLNEELEGITQTYRSTDIFPVVKVMSGPHTEHPVIEQLRKGVTYKENKRNAYFPIKLGTEDYKISEVREMLTEYPDLTLFDVVKQMLVSRKIWDGLKDKLNFYYAEPYRIIY